MTAFALPRLRALPLPRWAAAGRRWESASAVTIALFALLTYTWNLGFAGYSTFYSAASRSMTMSWRAFWFGAFDPGAHITLDKLSGFLIPQALSARMFGYHPWSLALPQAIEGMITVLAVYVIGRRWRGPAVGLLAAGIAATTPVFSSMFGHVMEDGLLTMSLALAACCWQSAVLRTRVRSLIFAGVWIGVGFQAKMIQAWLILPGLALGLLLLTAVPWRRRLLNLLVLVGTTVTASLLWMTIIQLIPASRRPFIDGTTNNNMFSMVFGYNGINRVRPGFLPGVISSGATKVHSPALSIVQHGRRVASTIKPAGLQHNKLVIPYYATQIGWLYPAVVVGLVVEAGLLLRLWRQRSRATSDQAVVDEPVVAGPGHEGPVVVRPELDRPVPASGAATTVALVLWLVLAAGLLSATQVPHVAYLATIGVQLALLGAAGLVAVARRYHEGSGRLLLGLPTLVAASAAWACYLLWAGHAAPAELGWVVLGFALFALLILLIGRLASPVRRVAVVAGVLSVLLAPLIWTGYVFDRSLYGTAGEAYAGPRPGRHQIFRPNRAFTSERELSLTPSQRALLGYLAERHAGSSTLLTDNWTIAASYLLAARVPVLDMGGYTGLAPTPRLTQLQQLVATGSIRYALLLHEHQTHSQQASMLGTDDRWIRAHCIRLNDFALTDPDVQPVRPVDLYRCGPS